MLNNSRLLMIVCILIIYRIVSQHTISERGAVGSLQLKMKKRQEQKEEKREIKFKKDLH
jgi:hypothetical protein